jgi:hypothetical protein
MTIRLTFIRETSLARLYSDSLGEEFWVPKSVVRSTVKFKPTNLDPLAMQNEVHEIEVEDWWWDQKWGREHD